MTCLLSILLMGGCGASEGTDVASADVASADVASADVASADTVDSEEEAEQYPVLWGEPVEARDAHAYCMKMSRAEETECNQCVCTHCEAEVVACYLDEGCTWMRECTFEFNCSGWECLGPCGDVFARYGGKFGPSGPLIEALGQCGAENCSICMQ
jgi:hypothetical protein